MDEYVEQSKYNYEFLEILETKEPDRYFDWKITIAFYCALHCIKALLANRGIEVETHEEIKREISHRQNQSSPVSQECWKNYNKLYLQSRSCRYNGFKDRESFNRHNKNEYQKCKAYLDYIRKYINHKHKIPILKE